MNKTVHRVDCSLFRPIPRPHMAVASIKELLALTFRSLSGYRYYYCQDQGKVCAYLFLKHNHMGHYAFMKRSDLLINPYKTLPLYRRQGYAAALLDQAIADASRDKLTLYAIVTQDNAASQAALLKAGFRQLGYVDYRPRWFDSAQQFITSVQTSRLLFAFDHTDNGSLLGED